MKKSLKIFLIIIAILAITLVGIFIYRKINFPTYTVNEITENIKNAKLPNNILIHSDHSDNLSNKLTSDDTYIFNNQSYINQKNSENNIYAETFINMDNYKLISIIPEKKYICYNNINPEDFSIYTPPYGMDFIIMTNEMEHSNIEYEFLGYEKINNHKCIKVTLTHTEISLDNNEVDHKSIYTYWIDVNTSYIEKQNLMIYDHDNKLICDNTTTTTYTYDCINESNMKQFNLDNYPGYTQY